MDDDNALPNDLAECQQLLLAAFKQATELEHVLDETTASYEALQAAHQAALEELSALKRWIYGRRTEKIIEGEGQGHLFDLEPSASADSKVSAHEQLSTKCRYLAAGVAENSILPSCHTIGTNTT